MLKADVSGRVRGRPRLFWMDYGGITLGSRGMTMEDEQQFAKERKELMKSPGTYVNN